MKYISTCLRQYARFSGRSGIAEAWVFFFFVFVVQAAALSVDVAMGWGQDSVVDWLAWYPAFEISRLLLLLPVLAVTARRLHDVNETGWKALLWLVPIIGWLHLLPLLVQDSDTGANPYGMPPGQVLAS